MQRIILSLLLISLLNFDTYLLAQVPDLQPEIGNITIRTNQSVDPADVAEGCAADVNGRTLIAFDHTVWNYGTADLSLGDPLCPDCETVGVPICGNPLFECSAAGGHNHPHLRNFSDYTVYNRSNPSISVKGHKEGFCLVNSFCLPDVIPPTGDFQCNFLAAGCADFYGSGLGCQYVDITDLKPGKYTLKVELNPGRTINEFDYSNNIVEYNFKICKKSHKLKLYAGPWEIDSNITREYTLEGSLPLPSKPKFNPIKSYGLSLILNSGVEKYFDFPPFRRGQGCLPGEGWKKVGVGHWVYRNLSGYNNDCTYRLGSAIKKAEFKHIGKNLEFKIEGAFDIGELAKKPKNLTLNFADFSSSANETCSGAKARRCFRTGDKGRSLFCR